MFRYHRDGLMEKQRFLDFRMRINCCNHLLSLPAQNRPDNLLSDSCVGKSLTAFTDITVLIAFAVFGYLLENEVLDVEVPWSLDFSIGKPHEEHAFVLYSRLVSVPICVCASRPLVV